jgi:hypothetical protein
MSPSFFNQLARFFQTNQFMVARGSGGRYERLMFSGGPEITELPEEEEGTPED